MKINRKYGIIFSFIFLLILFICGYIFYLQYFSKQEIIQHKIPFLNTQSAWIDSLVKNAAIEQKLGNMVMLETGYINENDAELITKWIKQYKLGWIIFKTDSLKYFLNFKNKFIQATSLPLATGLHSIDGYPEFISDFIDFPAGTILDAVSDDSLHKEYSDMVAKHLEVLGLQFCLFPSYENIHFYGGKSDDYYMPHLFSKTSIFAKSLEEKNILSCLVSFDYQSDIITDSSMITSLDFYKPLITQSMPGIVVLKNSIFILNTSKSSKISTGQSVCQYLLQNQKFEGLLISKLPDDFNENDVRKLLLENTDIFLVRNNLPRLVNILKDLYIKNILTIDTLNIKFSKILKAKVWTGIRPNEIEIAKNFKRKEEKANIRMGERVKGRKGERAKGRMGGKFTDINTIMEMNHSGNYISLSKRLYKASLTLVKNENNIVPFIDIDTSITAIVLGNQPLPYFIEYLKKYACVKDILINSSQKFDSFRTLPRYNSTIILAYNNIIPDTIFVRRIMQLLKKSNKKLKFVVINFGSIQSLSLLQDLPVVLQVYDSSAEGQKHAAEVLFGGIAAQGVIPFTLSDSLRVGEGFSTNITRLQYALPEEAGISNSCIKNIDSIITDAIANQVFPGCQVFIAKDGKVIYDKAFGYHTYQMESVVREDDLYDIASITKILGTTLAAMKMIENEKMSLNDKLEKFFKNTTIEYTRIKPDTLVLLDTLNLFKIKNLDKLLLKRDTFHLNDSIIIACDTIISKVTPELNIFKREIRDVLAHMSGLPPSMPVLKYIQWSSDTLLDIPDTIFFKSDSFASANNFSKVPNFGKVKTYLTRSDSIKYLYDKYFTDSYIKDTSHCEIANNMFLRNNYFDSLWIDVKQIRVFDKSVYMYSDVNMFILQQAIDSVNGYGIDKFLAQNFYKPLGARTICYRPLQYFPKERIIPTVNDVYFRRQLVHGYVHDESAALVGGISGNAGLFSNAGDLGLILQMLLNGGEYGGRRYLKKETIELFTASQPDIYRGLGFDKKGVKNIITDSASVNSYGHTGFTGCCVWVDPDINLIYVFLSNRVHPQVKNWKINTLKIRQKIHQEIYR
ncbi:MAG: serine hydrolase [Bacteroidia bacterium]|nr:serine hydrolase [Bacteroidia bacterium]